MAAGKGHASVVDALLNAGARTDLKSKYGKTALDAFNGEVVEALLRAAAKKTPAQRIAEVACKKRGFASCAVEAVAKNEEARKSRGHDSCAAEAADIALADAQPQPQQQVQAMLARPGADVDQKHRRYNSTALMEAAFYGRAPLVVTLLHAGATPDLQAERGVTALMAAAVGNHDYRATRQRQQEPLPGGHRRRPARRRRRPQPQAHRQGRAVRAALLPARGPGQVAATAAGVGAGDVAFVLSAQTVEKV